MQEKGKIKKTNKIFIHYTQMPVETLKEMLNNAKELLQRLEVLPDDENLKRSDKIKMVIKQLKKQINKNG